MTVSTPPTPGGRRLPGTSTARFTRSFRRMVVDSATMTRRGVAHWVRSPGELAVGLVFPVMMLIMFAYFLGGGMAVEDGNYIDFLVPGMYVLTMAFGLEGTMTAVSRDADRGVLDRFRSMPIAPSAMLTGRSILDMLNSAAGLLVMVSAGLLIGWRWHGGAAAILTGIGLLLLLRFAMLWIGIYLGLLAGKPELVQAVQILIWPVAFLSNVFTSPETMPRWMATIAEWNPISASAAALRELFGNPTWITDGSWASENAMTLAIAWPLALLVVFVPLAIRRFTVLGR